jgi:membrane protein YdbS with pleckstrin-like domain
MQEYVMTLLAIIFGAVGYLLVTFWFQPILRYRDVKYQIASDLVYYTNALELRDSRGLPRERMQERMDRIGNTLLN